MHFHTECMFLYYKGTTRKRRKRNSRYSNKGSGLLHLKWQPVNPFCKQLPSRPLFPQSTFLRHLYMSYHRILPAKQEYGGILLHVHRCFHKTSQRGFHFSHRFYHYHYQHRNSQVCLCLQKVERVRGVTIIISKGGRRKSLPPASNRENMFDRISQQCAANVASQGTQNYTNSTLGIGTVRRQKTSHMRNGGTILKQKDTEKERKTINKNMMCFKQEREAKAQV